MPQHVIKDRFEDKGGHYGVPLDPPIAWCGRKCYNPGWYFTSAQHVLQHLIKDGGIAPCKNCLRAIRKVINEELGDAQKQQSRTVRDKSEEKAGNV